MTVLAAAAFAAVLAVALGATAVTIPASRRAQMLRILATFGGSRISDLRPRRPTFTEVARPPVVRFLQLVGDIITPSFSRQRLTRRLDQAGNPPAWPLDRVIRARMVGAVLGAIFGYYLGGILVSTPLSVILGTVIGVVVPELLVHNAAVKRQRDIERTLPDVLDALVIGVEAGLGLDAALTHVAAMLRGPMPDEINRMLHEMRLGVARTQALRALSARTSVRDLKRLVTALVQAGELGISISGILREHAADQRSRRRQRAEEQAQKVAVKLLFPVLICLFPVIFIVVLGPAVLSALRDFT
ncbi:type II secretion system F family protein [Actinoplanes sp. TBRC 11911]|uniref:type II secretion system F family protein n=1 Tax=Actinoplanes sp. TBRC 11911 TaxID=2729386 RepID=UPI00145EA80E|nr:type II secretion system F family protein [Actinoplanes sp. TBRC 11911]NMO56178.1 type II secretion system F family protein [Actinoplanes sp. TBRC 11911]